MKQAFKVFYFRDKMANKPTVKDFTALVNLTKTEGLTTKHVDSLISELNTETKNTIAALKEFRKKLTA